MIQKYTLTAFPGGAEMVSFTSWLTAGLLVRLGPPRRTLKSDDWSRVTVAYKLSFISSCLLSPNCGHDILE